VILRGMKPKGPDERLELKRIASGLSLFLVVCGLSAQTVQTPDRSAEPLAATNDCAVAIDLPGHRADGSVLLPNQWSLRPAGRQVELGDFPVNMAVHPSGRYVAVLHSGHGAHQVMIVDLRQEKAVGRAAVPEAFYGLEFCADGKRLYCSGAGDEVVHVFDFKDGVLKANQDVRLRDPKQRGIPCGLALSRDGRTVYAANVWGQSISIAEFPAGTNVMDIVLAPSSTDERAPATAFENKKVVNADLLAVTKRAKAALDATRPDAPFPYACVLDPKRHRLYVSLWAQSCVAVVDLKSNEVVGRWATGPHPNEMVLSRSRRYLFVANANHNTVTVLDTRMGTTIETLDASLSPGDLPGSTPESLALSPDERTLFVANACNNNIAVFDVSLPGKSHSLGFIPVGWYPTSVRVTPDGRHLLVANGKGLASSPNAREPQPVGAKGPLAPSLDEIWKEASSPQPSPPEEEREQRRERLGRVVAQTSGQWAKGLSGNKLVKLPWSFAAQLRCSLVTDPEDMLLTPASLRDKTPAAFCPTYFRTGPKPPTWQSIKELFPGTLSIIDLAKGDAFKAQLGAFTAQAYQCTPRQSVTRAAVAAGNPVPRNPGEPSPIKYCIYIIKENRTYDQVLGDVPEGNGAPGLCLFPERVTPNHHKIAREFVLLDNFYVDAEVSADGHEWSMGAYASDFVEKTWPLSYGHNNRGKYPHPSEGGFPIASPANGYIWDRAKEAGVSYRSYGEFVYVGKTPKEPGFTKVEALQGHFDPWYRTFDTGYPDIKRAERFIGELKRFEAEGDMPRLQIVRLPNDHTCGTLAGSFTPSAYLADNDRGLGMVVEAVSHSRFWPQTAIFVLEDDAQDGPDHVDAHRSPAFVISPYTRRGAVDSTMYSTSSMLRTMELILGLRPMTQFDAAATPMFNLFQAEADLRPYEALAPKADLTERNSKLAWGSSASSKMDFSKEDAADEMALSEIIWRSVRGSDAPMPAPVHAAFVFQYPKESDDD